MLSSKTNKSSITARCTLEEKKLITIKWKEAKFISESDYLRFVALNAQIVVKIEKL